MGLKSIISYPKLGKWGDNKYRGNCSGYVIKDLIDQFKPKQFGKIFAGSGTGFSVAREMGYKDSFHLDLNPKWGGWNALTDEVPEGSDFIFLHPPYHDIIRYSGEMWGDPHPDDLSRCASYDEFIKKLDIVHAKAYASLRRGGRMAILVGDCRRKGEYFSIQKDMAWIGDMVAHIIKQQHNCVSDKRTYSNDLIPIVHEHLLVFRKNDIWVVPVTVTRNVKQDLRKTSKVTWRDIVQGALEQIGGKGKLDDIYSIVQQTQRAKGYPTVKEKVRQVLQIHAEFKNIERGYWQLAS